MDMYTLKDGSEYIIRRVTERDAVDIIRYSNTVGGESDFLSYGLNEFTHNSEQEKQIIREYNGCKNRLFIVAEIDGAICGSLTFWGNNRKRLEHWGELGISVSKKYWNKGIGSALLGYLLDWAEKGEIIKKLDLMVREDNYSAISLYEKVGFEIEGKIRRAMKIDERFYDFLYMGKIFD